jgi:hypothetical protein
VIFRGWCESRAVLALPATPVAVAGFLADQADQGIRPPHRPVRGRCRQGPCRTGRA